MTYEEYLIERAKLIAKLERAEGLLRRANANLARSKSEVARVKWTAEVERAQALIDLIASYSTILATSSLTP